MPRGEASSAGQLTAWPVAFLLLLVAALEWSPGRVTELDAARVQVSLLVASGGPHTIGTPSVPPCWPVCASWGRGCWRGGRSES